MNNPTVYKGVYGESSEGLWVNWCCIAAGIRLLLTFVVALAVATPGVAILVWVIDSGSSVEPAIASLVLFGVAVLVAAPTGLYRNEEVRGAALLGAFLLGCASVIAIFLGFMGKAMEDIVPNIFPWWLVTPAVVTALSAAAILVHKTRSGRKSG